MALSWDFEWVSLPLKYNWKLSRNETLVKENLYIKISGYNAIGIGEAAPNIRYGESKPVIAAALSLFLTHAPHSPIEPAIFSTKLADLNLPSALNFAIESAYMHWWCNHTQQNVGEYLGLKSAPKSCNTAFTLPIMPLTAIESFVHTHDLHRFKTLKVKVDQNAGAALLSTINQHYVGKIILDGNEAWTDAEAVIGFLNQIPLQNILCLEQPFADTNVKAYEKLYPHCRVPIVADESFQAHTNVENLVQTFDWVNLKLMKMGSYYTALSQLKAAKAAGLKVMLGCMVETSIGIWSAYQFASEVDLIDLDGFLIPTIDPGQRMQEKNGQIYPID